MTIEQQLQVDVAIYGNAFYIKQEGRKVRIDPKALCIMGGNNILRLKASEFDLGICPIHNRPVKIQQRPNAETGEVKWCIKMHEWCLGKDTDWHYELLPSSRTEEFVQNTRFDTPDEAYNFWLSNVKQLKPLYVG